MSKLQNLEYMALNASGNNYLQWALNTKINLKSKGLGECIEGGAEPTERQMLRATFIIRQHLAENLKNQYLNIEDPSELWAELKNRYDHQKKMLLPKAKHDWENLRTRDYKSVEEYNSELLKIVSILRLCGEEVTDDKLIEKTLLTFHISDGKGFKTYTDLISCLLLAEKDNELWPLYDAIRPTGSTTIPESHKAKRKTNYVHKRHYGRDRGRGRCGNHGDLKSDYQRHHHGGRGRGNHGRGRRGRGMHHPQNGGKSVCHKCGMDNHWANTCRTPKHLVNLYLKENY